jgi:hypothetical protein
MNLLLPLALWGLVSLPLILILHLLRHRRPQLPIASLQLWRGLQQKKQGRLPRAIPFSLMLLLQLFIAATLTLALAQPVSSFLLPYPQHLIFILDTTTSMLAEDASPRRFDAARQFIQQRLQTLAGKDTFTLIGLNAQPEILLSGDGSQKMEALLTLDNLVPGGVSLNLPAALHLANGWLDPHRQNQIIILTDGSFTVEPDSLPTILAPIEWQLFPTPPLSPPVGGEGGGQEGNQAVLNVSVRTLPDGRHRLFARAINYSDAPAVRTLRVWADDRQFDEISLSLDPQAETARIWTLPAAARTAAVELVELDVLPLDNRAEVWLADVPRYQVLLVSDASEPLTRALSAQPGVEVTVDSPTARAYNSQDFDLTVFEGDGLPMDMTAWPAGNILVVNPPLGHPLLPAQKHTRNLRPNPAAASPLLVGVDLSGVYFNRVVQFDTLPAWAEVDLDTANPPTPPLPLILHGYTGPTRLVVWAFDLANSNLPARLALPLLTANTLQALLAPAPQPVSPVGESVPINGNFSVEIPGGRRLFPPPGQSGWEGFFTRTKQPGLYQIYNPQNKPVAGFAIQAGSALESNLAQPLEVDKLNVQGSTLNMLMPQIDYYEYWPWLAGLVLMVVMFEGWLAWRR